MSKVRDVSLVLLLPSLVAGCPFGCGDSGGPQEEEGSEVITVSPEELEAALEDDGTLSLESCQSLCEATGHVADYILDCRTVEGTGAAQATSFGTYATGDTGPGWPQLECDFTYFTEGCVGGRDHAAIASNSRGRSGDPIVAWLQGTTHAETASVKAFAALAKELQTLSAPEELVRRCHEAACDEVAHARSIGGLLAERGAERLPLRFHEPAGRTLTQLAVENAREGCVKEVWAAALAHWQATHAQDDNVRAAMAPIARDEARHGDLARAIHVWAMEKLAPEDRDLVEAARAGAIEVLRERLASRSEAGRAALGLPSSADGLRLLEGLIGTVWAEA